VCETVTGHKSLKKCLKILAHLYELQREYGAEPHVQAFTAQAYKASVEAVYANGSWELAWPLLGLPDPEEKARPITSPAERVALAALAKERKSLEAARKTTTPATGASASSKASAANSS
jgi:hypothetical protein